MRNYLLFFIFLIICIRITYGQTKPASASDILLQLKKLNVLGSALYIAAHPDDENTQLLTYLAKERLVRTAYLALTRGDGGQNLIGSEQGENVGIIRTQELLAARRIDGAEQFFSRAYDFGFSKSTDEVLRTWGHNQVLADIVWAIRKYQPDVIITRFPPDNRAGHGHHSASAALAEEAFSVANDPNRYPEQLKYVKPWQAKRILWNMFIPGTLGNRRPEETGNMIGLETGLYNPLLGKSYGELASESRSQHKSQGFGVPVNRGPRVDYLLLKGGDSVKLDLFDGVDLSWKRVSGSSQVQVLVNQVIRDFRAEQPANSIPLLVRIYKELAKLDTTNRYVRDKRQEVETLIQQCLGLWFETNPTDYAASPGETVRLSSSIINRSDVPIRLVRIQMPAVGKDTTCNLILKRNERIVFRSSVTLAARQKISQPYWLEKPLNKGLFQVDDQTLIGLPENIGDLTTEYQFEIEGVRFTFVRPWIYKFTDPVDGELYRPFVVQPEVMTNLAERVYVFADNTPKQVDVTLRAGISNVSGGLKLSVPSGWRVEPTEHLFELKEKYAEQRLSFNVFPTSLATEGMLKAVVTTSNGSFSTGARTIAYKHIPTQTLFPLSEARLVKLDVVVKSHTIGYIAGAGDEVPAALRQIGCRVTQLSPAELMGDLSSYDAIVTGVRAYNTQEWLRYYQPKLLEYVKNGGTLVVQYVTPGGGFIQNELKVSQLGPYPFTIGYERVAEEDAKMTFLNPKHLLLNTPNQITDRDFAGWVQERGLYFVQKWDKAYEPVFSSNDAKEPPKQGSLLYASYGKGHFIYTGLAFFRQLPAGVPGAFRLFANLISVGK